ncbi:MAG: hypothetical protein ORN24_00035 [Burkholderiales bacterium]|nr:hypothetical protein [Burkholderiales bacterium]
MSSIDDLDFWISHHKGLIIVFIGLLGIVLSSVGLILRKKQLKKN